MKRARAAKNCCAAYLMQTRLTATRSAWQTAACLPIGLSVRPAQRRGASRVSGDGVSRATDVPRHWRPSIRGTGSSWTYTVL